MKFNKYIAFALVLSLIGAFFLPTKTIASNGTTDTVYDTKAVSSKSDFKYRLLPRNKPSYISIVGYVGKSNKVVIPSTIEGLPVTGIAASAFYRNDKVQEITLPKTLTYLTGLSFRLTTSLKNLYVDSANPKYTSKDGIIYTKDMKTLVAAPGGISGYFRIPYGVVRIGEGAFSHRSRLTSLDMYNTVESIDKDAFSYCTALSKVRLSDNLKIIGENAFRNCDFNTITLPYSLEELGQNALIAGIDSNNNVFYNFTEGVYYVPGTKAEKLMRTLHLPKKYYIPKNRTLTHTGAKITIIDNNGVLPKTGLVDFKLSYLNKDTIKKLAPVRYKYLNGYNLSITLNGKPIDLKGKVVLKFDGASAYSKTAVKLYRVSGSNVTELVRTPDAPFVGTITDTLGSFMLLANDNFSIKGDVDGDGIVTTYDSRIALAHVAKLKVGLLKSQITCGDMNSAYGITTYDARQILKKAAGIIK